MTDTTTRTTTGTPFRIGDRVEFKKQPFLFVGTVGAHDTVTVDRDGRTIAFNPDDWDHLESDGPCMSSAQMDARISLTVGARDQLVRIAREVSFTRDLDGSWMIHAHCLEDRDAKGGYGDDAREGGIHVKDPAVASFLAHLMRLLACPDADPYKDWLDLGPMPATTSPTAQEAGAA